MQARVGQSVKVTIDIPVRDSTTQVELSIGLWSCTGLLRRVVPYVLRRSEGRP